MVRRISRDVGAPVPTPRLASGQTGGPGAEVALLRQVGRAPRRLQIRIAGAYEIAGHLEQVARPALVPPGLRGDAPGCTAELVADPGGRTIFPTRNRSPLQVGLEPHGRDQCHYF